MDNILVIVIVLAAAFYVGRRIYLAISSKKSSCGCDAKCDSCDLFDN
ncbi:MAG: FeoB-associated Cys-rich membrane protein, partial [Deltaproteobacteria bacterium]